MRLRTIVLILLLTELLSFTAFFLPPLKIFGFVVVIAAVLIASLLKLEYGLYVATTELIIGGMGYLFSLPLGPNSLSLRLGIFLTVMAVWLAKVLNEFREKNFSFPALIKDIKTSDLKLLRFWGLFVLAVAWGLFIGFWRGNDFGNLFLDANGYFFFALILPFLWVKNKLNDQDKKTFLQNITTIFLVATTWLACKTLLIVYFLTHLNLNFFAANFEAVYLWIRNSGVGEITWLPGNFARVFFQSHIYSIAAFFILLTQAIGPSPHPLPRGEGFEKFLSSPLRERIKVRGWWKIITVLILNVAVIIIALSRSFWAGVLVGLVVLAYFCFKQNVFKKYLVVLPVILILGALLLVIVARFPIPAPGAIDFNSIAKSRLSNEEAASSRWNLLPPLWSAVKEHWLLGQGFGATVTYISNDPRVRAESPTGLYTTYAFEWGWLDLWLKLGLIGLSGYLCFLGYLLFQLWQRIKTEPLYAALFTILVSLVVISVFTPYLNHPLGFGILILMSVFI